MSDETTALPQSLVDTRGMAPKDAVEFWYETIGVMFDTRLRNHTPEEFRARVEGFLLGDVVFGTVNTHAQTFDRSRFKLGRDGLDHVLIQFYTQGTLGPRDGGSDEWTQPGDLWITDLAKAQATAATDHRSINLIVPRRMLSPLLDAPDDHNMLRIPGGAPLVSLLHSHMEALFVAAPHMNAADAHAVVQPTLALAAAAINGAAGEHVHGGVATALYAAIARHVRDRLYDPQLSADRVAAAFGISPRKLHYLFESSGGFTAHVQRERLRDIRRALTDPAEGSRSIADIAEAHGFTNAKSFSRAFRREFGVTAREVRGLAAERKDPAVHAPPGSQWWSWVEHMR